MEQITAKISGLEIKQGIKGDNGVHSENLTQRSENWKGPLGEMVANTQGEGITPEAAGTPGGSGQGGASVHGRQENHWEQ